MRSVICVALLVLSGSAVAQVDLAGEWRSTRHEDQIERGPGPEIGDFTGLPLNEAGRRRGLSWSASLLTVPEHQCSPHPANYAAMHGNLRISKEVDPQSLDTVAWHLLHESYNRFRVVYMDGRPHPGDDERHTWQGFSTGRWVGNALEITTTDMKESRIRRNGVEHSDEAVLVEFLTRHGDILTFISILEDPHSLEEPYIHTRNFVLDTNQTMRPYPCRGTVEIDRPRGQIPHFLPGENTFAEEYRNNHGIPREAALGGAATTLPEYRERLRELLNSGELH